MNKFIFIVFLCLALNGHAQDDESPPPLNPYDSPWGEPVSSQPARPTNTNPTPPADDSSDQDDEPSFVPPNFSGSSSSSKSQAGEGKSSFMLIEESNVDQCKAWSNQMLSNKSFSDFNDCQFNLDRKLEETRSAIEHSVDTVERFKLKKMLRGKMKNEERKQNQMDYSKLEARLKAETKKGCICVKK